VVEERDELLADLESEKVQASHHKERADKLAKELANARRRVKRMELRLASANDGHDHLCLLCVDRGYHSCFMLMRQRHTGKRRKGKRSRSNPESSDASTIEAASDPSSESDSSDEDKFTSPPARRKDSQKKIKKEKKKKVTKSARARSTANLDSFKFTQTLVV